MADENEIAGEEEAAINRQIVEYLEGTCRSEFDAANAFGVEVDQVHEAAREGDLELCEQCGWWAEASEMTDVGICNECFES